MLMLREVCCICTPMEIGYDVKELNVKPVLRNKLQQIYPLSHICSPLYFSKLIHGVIEYLCVSGVQYED